jgi:hypothetical protein
MPELFAEITARGYTGSAPLLRRFLRELRTQQAADNCCAVTGRLVACPRSRRGEMERARSSCGERWRAERTHAVTCQSRTRRSLAVRQTARVSASPTTRIEKLLSKQAGSLNVMKSSIHSVKNTYVRLTERAEDEKQIECFGLRLLTLLDS